MPLLLECLSSTACTRNSCSSFRSRLGLPPVPGQRTQGNHAVPTSRHSSAGHDGPHVPEQQLRPPGPAPRAEAGDVTRPAELACPQSLPLQWLQGHLFQNTDQWVRCHRPATPWHHGSICPVAVPLTSRVQLAGDTDCRRALRRFPRRNCASTQLSLLQNAIWAEHSFPSLNETHSVVAVSVKTCVC